MAENHTVLRKKTAVADSKSCFRLYLTAKESYDELFLFRYISSYNQVRIIFREFTTKCHVIDKEIFLLLRSCEEKCQYKNNFG